MNLIKLAACITTTSLLIACGGGGSSSSDSNNVAIPDINMANAQKVINTNADIALAAYTDSVATAKELQTALATFKTDPTEENLTAAKKAWLVSREPYGQTEVYRFRESPIDEIDGEDGPEGDINAWPLGEALIDYVETNASDFGDDQVGVTANDAGINGGGAITAAQAQSAQSNNIIGNTAVTIDNSLLENTLSAEDEHDVISGYHAIEFLLWGQDLKSEPLQVAKVAVEEQETFDPTTDGTDRDEAINMTSTGGQRPIEDFMPGITESVTYDSTVLSHRRHQFLEVAVDKLISDLEDVQAEWEKNIEGNYRDTFTTISNEADAKQKLTAILTGMGTLSEGELAGERIQIAFSSNSQEDEHSCFSDNTHRDIWLNAEGVSNSFYGTYAGYDHDLDPTTPNIVSSENTAVNGYGIDDYLTDAGLTEIVTTTTAALDLTETNYKAIDASARAGSPFDVLIMNPTEDSDVSKTVKSLSAQARLLQSAASQLGLGTVVDEEASSCNTQDPTTACE
jgi:putative iron-regulated protein